MLAVRYATRATRKSEVYLHYEPDEPIGMDYYFWVIRNERRTLVVDCGFTRTVGEHRGRTVLCEPPETLGRLGIDPLSVPQLILTHAHYDHVGNVPAFANAELIVSERKLAFWIGPCGERPQFATSVEAADIAVLAAARRHGRTTAVTGRHAGAPGVEVIEVGGHTPGQLIVVVATATGAVVLASDAVHYYEELDRDWPYTHIADLERTYLGYDTLRAMAAQPGTILVAGHDPAVRTRFPALGGGEPTALGNVYVVR